MTTLAATLSNLDPYFTHISQDANGDINAYGKAPYACDASWNCKWISSLLIERKAPLVGDWRESLVAR